MTGQTPSHHFINPSLSQAARPNYQPSIKLSFFFSKHPSISSEHFHRHWETVHADLTIAAQSFRACKIRRYVQVHQTDELKEKARSLGVEHLDFDGCSEIWVERWEDYTAFSESEEYRRVMQPDSRELFAMPIRVFVGQENLIFGEAVPGLGGMDGVVASNLKTVG